METVEKTEGKEAERSEEGCNIEKCEDRSKNQSLEKVLDGPSCFISESI